MLTKNPHRRSAAISLAIAVMLTVLSPLLPRGSSDATATEPRAHWGQATVTVRDETGYPEYRRAVELAAERWNAAGAKIRLVVANGRGTGCSNPALGEIPVCRHAFSGSRAGEARVWEREGHIVRASVLIDTRPMPFEHLVAVACHELGHAFGMPHREERTSCLTAVIHSSDPDERDLSRLKSDHAHVPHLTPHAPQESPGGQQQPAPEDEERCEGPQLLRIGTTCGGTLLPRHVH